ncbi:hypothetical protein [Acuticoccus mangrovi]|uniref:Sulfotransferase domain-containing protein n=1 Tax=Acuticoccus mangrovi TaxID=2796142 RepID=A0A934MHP2_9HYPH|nr:hypothetical protein [Acuticoccus mangrovi]MBJ3777883.1 hypothetical protein [Acuticoccus mangrovi]
MNKVVIVTKARSGSNLLLSLLNSHPDFYFHGEVYKPGFVATFRTSGKFRRIYGVEPIELRENDPIKFLDAIYSTSPRKQKAVGFKLFFYHNKDVLDYIINDKDIKIVLLERENRLASFSSLLIGQRTSTWQQQVDKDENSASPGTVKVDFKVEDLIEYKRKTDRTYERFRNRITDPSRLFEARYHELLDSEFQQRLVSFLGGEPNVPLEAGVVKQNPAKLVDRFTNAQDVMSYLESAGLSHWAEE